MDIEIDTHAPETKAGIAREAFTEHERMMRLFEDYRATNDERVATLEKRGVTDVVTEDKVARLNAALDTQRRRIDDITLKGARPNLEHGRGDLLADTEHKAAFHAYVRGGESAGLRALEQKAMSIGSNPDGGYLVPEEVERAIGSRLTVISPIRSIAGVRKLLKFAAS